MGAFNFKVMARLREKMNLSRRDVVMSLHDIGVEVTENTILNWEEGQTTPDADKLMPLCKVFGVSVDELIS